MSIAPGLISLLPTFLARDGPTVNLKQGTLVGKLITNRGPVHLDSFLGVRYAKPPIGDRRFARTSQIGPSDEVFSATKFGARCAWTKVVGKWAEDCLFANIFRPAGTAPNAKLPVMVHFHGGSFNSGWGASHGTANMVGWSENPFIGINFNYRLGALGFLPSNITADQGILNLGLHDQVLMLEWVQDNIEVFGGDPSRVTLLGFSAGAHSVGHHLMRMSEQKLFHQVMMDSGAPTARGVYPYDSELNEKQFKEFVTKVGCGDVLADKIIGCLREQDAEKLARISGKIYKRYDRSKTWPFQPVIDGDLIAKAPIKAWNAKEFNKVPIFTGFSNDEGSVFAPSKMATGNEFNDYFKNLIPQLTEDDIDSINNLYPDPMKNAKSAYKEFRDIKVGSQYRRMTAAYGEYAYVCPVQQTAHKSAEANNPIYMYRFGLVASIKTGAKHGVMLKYQEYQANRCGGTPSQKKLAGYTHAYYTSFITTGNPNTIKGRYADRPEWVPWVPGKPAKIMVLGEGNDECVKGGHKGTVAKLGDAGWVKAQCKYWWEKTILSES